LLLCKQKIKALSSTSSLQMLSSGVDLLAEGTRLEGSHQVILIRARGREGELRVLEIEIYDFGKGMDFCDFELADKICQAFFELVV
jgi:hypothetical protein